MHASNEEQMASFQIPGDKVLKLLALDRRTRGSLSAAITATDLTIPLTSVIGLRVGESIEVGADGGELMRIAGIDAGNQTITVAERYQARGESFVAPRAWPAGTVVYHHRRARPERLPGYMVESGERPTFKHFRMVWGGFDVPYLAINVHFPGSDTDLKNWRKLLVYLRFKRADGQGRTIEGILPLGADGELNNSRRQPGNPYTVRERHLRRYLGWPNFLSNDPNGSAVISFVDDARRAIGFFEVSRRTFLRDIVDWIYADDGHDLGRIYESDERYASDELEALQGSPDAASEGLVRSYQVVVDVAFLNGADPRIDTNRFSIRAVWGDPENTPTEPPPIPDVPIGTALWSGIVDLEWNDVPGAESYEVQLFHNDWFDLPARGINVAFYGPGAIIRDLPTNINYYFRVRAVNSRGASKWSDYLPMSTTHGPSQWTEVPEPTNSPATGAPTISGTPQVNLTLAADVSGISDENGLDRVKLHYQWTRSDGTDAIDIEGATGTSYPLTTADTGRTIRVRVSFVDRHGFAESLTSGPAEVAAGDTNTPATGAPTISGTAQVGQTLTVDTSGIADDDGLDNATYTYQWLADDTDIAGATGSSYTLIDSDEGKAIKVRVSFTDDAGNEESLTSEATDAVEARPNSPATGAPTISGTAQVGQTLTADTSGIADGDGLDNVYFTYQWIAGDVDIDGATGSSYTLADSDEGKAIKVRVSFTDDAGNEETLTSAATSAVAAAPTPLTAQFLDTPSSHDGQAAFTLELRFSEEFELSYKTLRDHAFTVTGGEVTGARRLEKPSNIRWEISVSSDGDGNVTIVLPVTVDCNDQGAICAQDGRRLSAEVTLTVAGPGE